MNALAKLSSRAQQRPSVARTRARTVQVYAKQTCYLCLISPKEKPFNMATFMKAFPSSRAYIQDLDKRGLLAEHGPFMEPGPGEGQFAGEAMFVLLASSYEEAVKLAEADPLVTMGVSNVVVKIWQKERSKREIDEEKAAKAAAQATAQ